jgi:hypothetical protein
MEDQGGPIVETALEARGGLLGRPVLAVLVVSTLLAIALFAIIYASYFGLTGFRFRISDDRRADYDGLAALACTAG